MLGVSFITSGAALTIFTDAKSACRADKAKTSTEGGRNGTVKNGALKFYEVIAGNSGNGHRALSGGAHRDESV